MDGFLLDLRCAWRSAMRRPALTALTVVTLVLGIGANTAIFAVARGVLLRPLPYQDPDSLAMIWRNGPTSTDPRGIGTPEMLREYRARNSTFSDIAAVELWRSNLSAQIDLAGADGAERLRGSLATPNFFSLLGVNAAMGRTFAESDEAGVVVLSDALWRRRYGADPAIVGQTIDLVGARAHSRTARRDASNLLIHSEGRVERVWTGLYNKAEGAELTEKLNLFVELPALGSS